MISKITQHLVVTSCLLMTAFCPGNAQIYVNINSGCSAECDGSSWEKAFADLQDALAVATNGDQVWVAQGIYIPHTTDRTVFFRLNDVVQLYG
mgnify:FL=1